MKITKKSDGIIFFGGADIPPYVFNILTISYIYDRINIVY